MKGVCDGRVGIFIEPGCLDRPGVGEVGCSECSVLLDVVVEAGVDLDDENANLLACWAIAARVDRLVIFIRRSTRHAESGARHDGGMVRSRFFETCEASSVWVLRGSQAYPDVGVFAGVFAGVIAGMLPDVQREKDNQKIRKDEKLFVLSSGEASATERK